jgi:hypothetical protein
MALNKTSNEYAQSLGDVFDKTPKAVFAAIAASFATCGGDYLNEAQMRIINEWWTLYENGIVPQKPLFPRVLTGDDVDDDGKAWLR